MARSIPIEVIDVEIEALEQVIQGANLKLDILRSLRTKAIDGDRVKSAIESRRAGLAGSAAKANPEATSATAMILAAVRSSPGIQQTAVADALQSKITTKSDNPRKVILATCDLLVRRKRMRRDDDRGLTVVERAGT